MAYILIFICFMSVFFLSYGILKILNGDKVRIENRLEQVKELHKFNEEEIETTSFFERIIKPFCRKASKILIDITPRHKIVMLNKKLEKAGILKNTTTEKWIFNKSIFIAIMSGTIGILSFAVSKSLFKSMLVSVLIMLLVDRFFNFYLLRKVEYRKKKILRDLPYTLDLITVSVEAGLSFDGALEQVISNIEGELCDEFAKSLKEVRMGIERNIALKNMSERCDVKEFSMFIISLIQADELGVSLSRVLRIESANLREHRKQLSREKAMKAPIKMLFPLVFFIFPNIFIIILGPALIRMINIFSKR